MKPTPRVSRNASTRSVIFQPMESAERMLAKRNGTSCGMMTPVNC
jgi:hypothetical protein